MRDSLTKKQFIIACIINGLNTFFYFFGFPFVFNFHKLIFLTMITLDLNCIYLFLSFICDISLFIFKSDRLEKMNDILRNKISNVINPISYLVTILFWFLVIFGGIINAFATAYKAIHSIYCHLIISIFLIIDIFIAEHKRHYFSWINLGIIFAYLIIYFIIACVATFKYDDPPYHFLESITFWPLLGCCILFSIIAILCYFFQILILKIKFVYILKIKDVPENYNEEINKVIQMSDM